MKKEKQCVKTSENIYNIYLEIFSYAEQNNMTTRQAMQIAENRIEQRKKENANR